MTKISVKRPFLVLVGVIMVLVLGAVAFTKMKTDLLPSVKLPYINVITTYPGAAPEKIESSITEPIENGLGTVNGVKNVTSSSAENYSMVALEFSEDMDMDSALAKVSRQLDMIDLPEEAGKPMVLAISSDMLASMYVGVTKDKADIYELSDFVNDNIVPEIKRQDGVASVSLTGMVEKSIEVRLNQKKIDKVNNRILENVDDSLATASKKLSDSQSKIQQGQSSLRNSQSQLSKQQQQKSEELAKYTKQLNEAVATEAAYDAQVKGLEAQIAALKSEKKQYETNYQKMDAMIQAVAQNAQGNPMIPTSVEEAATDKQKFDTLKMVLQSSGQKDVATSLKQKSLQQLAFGKQTRIPQIETELANNQTKLMTTKAIAKQVKDSVKKAKSQYEAVETGKISAAAAFGSSSAQLSAAETSLKDSEKQIEQAKKDYEKSAKAARENANLDALLEMDTLAKMLSAQNFDMPAGYISDDKTQYLLKVGDTFSSLKELKNNVLCNMDGVGDIRLSDVADVTMIDNATENYARIGKQDAVVLAITKSSTAYTSEVSKACNAAFQDMEKRYKGIHFLNVMDQGDYIHMIVSAVLKNLIYGAVLAILVLMVFLKDFRPTIVIGFSIPLSVMFAIVLMYFTDITFNVISLSGLALGIGMLVDNSIVSIENIYRLRGLGIPAARAAVMGAKQIAGAITASTLTTICVFLPILFTDGLTRELMMDMCLTIAFSLLASLVVALTVVPAMSATLLKNDVEKKHRLFDRFVDAYEVALQFCLKRKFVPLILAIALLIFSVWQVVRMGIVIMPEMGSNQMSVTIELPEDTDNMEDAKTADDVIEKLASVKGVKKVAAMASKGSLALMGIKGVESDDIKNIEFFIILKDEYAKKNGEIAKKMENMLEDMELKDYNVSKSNMDMSAMLATGLEIDIKGKDLDQLLSMGEDIKKLVKETGGFEEITDGQEQGDEQISVIVNKNKAARLGLTVAQVYADLAKMTTTEKQATTLTIDNKEYAVNIVDENDTLDANDLLAHKIETKTKNSKGEEVTKQHALREFAKVSRSNAMASINRDNQTRYLAIKATPKEGYNTTLLSRKLQKKIDNYKVPAGYSIDIAGESEETGKVVKNMLLMMILGFLFIYLIMVAQFQSLLSPFIVIFTIPLAFTGGLISLLVAGDQLSMMCMMGFLILMGVVVNNGIVFVDYVNQLRVEGKSKKEALLETGRARIRPILMTAFTTIFAMATMIFSKDIGSDMSRDMSIVVVGGLLYATLMTLFIVPVLYDLLFRRQIRVIDVDDEITK